MHRLLTLVYYRGGVEGKSNSLVTVAERARVRWYSINREIARIHSALVDRVRQVNHKVRRLSRHHAATGRVGSGHGKTDQLSVGEGVLL